MKEEGLEDPWKCEMNDCSNISSFPENSSWLINSQEEHFSLSILSALRWTAVLPRLAFCFLWLKEKRQKVKWPSLSFLYFITFIFLFSYSLFFLEGGDSSRWWRTTTKPELRRWRMIYLLPLLHFLLFFSSILVPWWKEWDREKMSGRRRWRETNRTEPLWKPSAVCKQSEGGTDDLTSKVKNISLFRGLLCKEGDVTYQSNSSSSPRGSLFCVLLFDMNHVRTRSKGRGWGPIISHYI